MIPGFHVTFGELERACAFLVSRGWAGGLTFDEAVKALDDGPENDQPTDEFLAELARDHSLRAATSLTPDPGDHHVLP